MFSKIIGHLAVKIKQSMYQDDIETLKLLAAKSLVRQNLMLKQPVLADVEFKVYSQFGDDGIIQHLISQVKILPEERRFVEFGVEDYHEANTRFLLINNHWKGLVLELDAQAVAKIKHDSTYWKYSLTALNCFITKKNIVPTISNAGFAKSLGLLSIDIDGNDYWICREILMNIKPVILVVEFNSLWGKNLAVTVPYQPDFYRFGSHYSGTYWGASIKAFHLLAKRFGYSFIGTNTVGLNAYFVRNDRLGPLKPVPIRHAAGKSIRDSRDITGRLDFLSPTENIKILSKLKLYNLESDKLESIKSLAQKMYDQK